MTNGYDVRHHGTVRIDKHWLTLLAQLQLEALAQLDRQLHRLTSVQRDIERLRAIELEGYDITVPEVRHVLRLLAVSVKTLGEEAKSAPETFTEMQDYLGVLVQMSGRGG
jgi:hypothetical protein